MCRMFVSTSKNFFSVASVIALPALLALSPPAHAQPAPARIAEILIPEVAEEVPSDNAKGAILDVYQESVNRHEWKGPRSTQVLSVQSFVVPEGTAVQVVFGETSLGEDGSILISSVSSAKENGRMQNQLMTQRDLENYGGATAYFPSGKIIIALLSGGGGPPKAKVQSLRVLQSGDDNQQHANIRAFRLPAPQSKEAFRSAPEEAAPTGEALTAQPETMCGPDNRIASSDQRIGRLMPIGCTGWLVGSSGDLALTAGHCDDVRMQIIEFQVPASLPDGRTLPADVEDQYPILRQTIVSRNDGVGRDWAIFRIGPNSNTGLTPGNRQGSGFMLSRKQRPTKVRVTGFGVDDAPQGTDHLNLFRNVQNQTQQSENGLDDAQAVFHDDGENDSFRYKVDTRGGNSGSPVINEEPGGGGTAIAIHTHGGCESAIQGNQGTALSNPDFISALLNFVPLASDVFVD